MPLQHVDTLTSSRFSWTTAAQDLHGNKTAGTTQDVVDP
jgi:hypothetical protein